MSKHQPKAPSLEALKPGTEWFSVPGFARYWASREGLVAYSDAGGYRLKATPTAQSGHKIVALSNGTSAKTITLMRLMALVFLEDPPTPQHKWLKARDGDIHNVQPVNLYWSDVAPSKGITRSKPLPPDVKTSLANALLTSEVGEVSAVTGFSQNYLRHLTPGRTYLARDKSAPAPSTQATPPLNASIEDWRTVPYATGYEVSSFGSVRSWRGRNPCLLKPVLVNGYHRVSLRQGSSAKQVAVHTLVAEAFCVRTSGTSVNHKDGNKTNNHFSNLEWTTPSENSRHAHKTGLVRLSNKHGKRWHRPPVSEYARIRLGHSQPEWSQVVVHAIRGGLFWADESSSIEGESWLPCLRSRALEVSSLGRVRRCNSHRLVMQQLSTHGYPTTSVYMGNGQSMPTKTHALVAEAFLGPRPSPKHVVNHRDGNKQNNKAGNLEWATYSENSQHWARELRPLGSRQLQPPWYRHMKHLPQAVR